MADVRAGWLAFNPAAAAQFASWFQFNPLAAQVCMSWAAFSAASEVSYSQYIDIEIDEKPKSKKRFINVEPEKKQRPKQQPEEVERLAKLLEREESKEEDLKVERKKVIRQKKKAKIRSPEYYELRTYEYLLTIEIDQAAAARREFEAQLAAMQAINERLAWQQQLAKEHAMLMNEMDMAFVMTMLMEA